MDASIDVTPVSKNLAKIETPLLVLAHFEEDESLDARGVEPTFGKIFARARRDGDFKGRKDDALLVYAPAEGAVGRLLVLGAGKRAEYGAETVRRLAGRAVRAAEKASLERLTFRLNPGSGDATIETGRLAQAATEGAALAAWDFRELKKNGKNGEGVTSDGGRPNGRPVRVVEISGEGKEESLLEGIRVGTAIARGENLARTLQMRPGNVATPTHLGEMAAEAAKTFGFEASILGPKELEAERMHALMAVARGSEEEARLIVLRHNGGAPDDPAVILVGKGLTFDSGGISLKPPQGMGDMKFDMSGGAAVIGALQAIAELDLPLNVVGIVPSSENLASGRSMKPGDVIRSRAGKTIEVGNTDAEGRLILADALSYAQEFSPAAVVDCATLTGACVVGLGHHAAAVLGNDEGLVQELRDAGERAGERCWPLPLWEEYRKQIDSTVADVSNVGGRPAGTITAALFLREFVGEMKWAHLDIAGTAYGDDPLPYQRKGGYGFPTRLLVEWVRSRAR
jgi:leucyl aminopeptidase